jgi:hypothetical protein
MSFISGVCGIKDIPQVLIVCSVKLQQSKHDHPVRERACQDILNLESMALIIS